MEVSTNNLLLPCPHCGGEAKISLILGNYIIACTECPSCMLGSLYQTKEQAIAAWNRRIKTEQEEV